MKVGIATFQWADNYGALLQAYALQSFLKERGHSVQIINYQPLQPIFWYHKWLAKTPKGYLTKWELEYKKKIFNDFRKNYLERTKEVFKEKSELKKIENRFELLITGSDQVWNPRWLSQANGLFDLCFLSFAGVKTRRISYAASFGYSNKETMKEEWQKIVSEKLNAMDAISVREQSGVTLVRNLCGRTDAVYSIDPTLLLEKGFYENFVDKLNKRNSYIFNYMLHGLDTDSDLLCLQISKIINQGIIKCNARKTRLHKGFTLPSPKDWLQRIRNASFVVTNSFHGVVFCLIFHKPFIALLINGENGSMNSRIVELLEAVMLKNRILIPNQALPYNFLTIEIDWGKVDKEISFLRKNAIEYLEGQNL